MHDRSQPPLLSIRDLRVAVPTPTGPALAVKGVDLELEAESVLALVGESGSGKTMTGHGIIRLQRQPVSVTGSVLFRGRDLLALPERELDAVRGTEIAMIFQDPQRALNPAINIGTQMTEVLRLKLGMAASAARAEAARLLEQVRIAEARRRLDAYPHELSGGMRQRVAIAMGIATNPALLIADEPTTALDVHVQADILDLLDTLRRELRMAVLFITHDFGVVHRIADRVAVMYAGRIVETGTRREIFARPRHPYTRGLIEAIPRLDRTTEWLPTIEGAVPPLGQPDVGCAFAPRCRSRQPKCERELPIATTMPVACHYPDVRP